MQKVISKRDIEKEIKKNEAELLNEGFWEDFKYYTAKVTGRYKANGKFFGKAKVDAEAKAKIDAILNKAGNDVIRKLDDFIKQTNPEFPNNRKGDDFLATVLHIASIYDSIENATKLQPNERGFLPIDAANNIIADLREYVKKFLDVDLKAVYTGLDEEEDIKLGEENQILNELDADAARANLKSRRKSGDDFASTRMDTLKSNKLPVVLASIGAGLGALGWVAQTDWLREILEYLFNKQDVSYESVWKQVTNRLNFNVESGDGFTQTVNKTLNLNLGPNTTTDQFINLMKEKGFGSSAEEIVKNYGIGGTSPNPRFIGDAAEALNQKGALLKDVFEGIMHGKAGTLMAVNPGPFLAKQIAWKLVKQAVVTTTTTGTALATGLAAAAPVLMGVGVALIGAGALVKLFRIKGQKQSRAATLNDLYQLLREIQPTKNNDTVIGLLPPAKTEPDGQKRIGGSSQGQLGQGEPEPKVTISGGGKKERKMNLDNIGDETPFEEIPAQGEPESQKQIGGRPKSKELTGGTKPRELGAGQPKTAPKKPYTQLNNRLTNFFKNILDIRRDGQENLQEEFEAIRGIRTPENKAMMNNFITSVKKLRSLSMFISRLSKTNIKNQELNELIKKLVQNKVHLTIIDIANLLEKYRDNSDMINQFVQIYMNNIKSKSNKFKNLQSILDSQSQQMNEAKGAKLKLNPQKFLKEFNDNFKIYLNNLYQLFEIVNKLRNGEQQTKPTSKEQTTDDFQTRANMGSSLEEGKKKKNKYSKKASEFIGKEISHLKKDKGYPQDRAVAAAINVAKEKGMKVGDKKKKKKISEEAPTIAPPKPKTPATPTKPAKPATPYKPKVKPAPKASTDKEKLPNWLSFNSLGVKLK